MSSSLDAPEWPWVLFRASAVPTAVAGAVAAIVAGVVRGPGGAAGALLGALLVVITFGLSLYVARRTAPLHPIATMTAALSSYVFTITLLLVVLVVVRRFGGVDREAVGLSLLVCVFVWLVAQLRGFLALPLLLDPAAGRPASAPGAGSAAPDVPSDGPQDAPHGRRDPLQGGS